MEQSFLARAINTTILTIAICLVLFAFTRNYTNPATALAISVFATIPIMSLISILKNKSLKKLGIKKSEINHAAACMTELWTKDPKAVQAFFLLLTKKADPNAKAVENFIVSQGKAIFPLFSNRKTTMQEIIKATTQTKSHKLNSTTIFSNDFEPGQTNIENTKFFNGIETYSLFKKYNTFPKISQKNAKIRTNLIKNMLKRTNFKKFLGITLIFSIATLFVSNNLLYILFTAIALTLAISCLIFGERQDSTKPLPF